MKFDFIVEEMCRYYFKHVTVKNQIFSTNNKNYFLS